MVMEIEKGEVGSVCRDDGELLDDDGKPKRTGTLWTASAHIITAVIGSGVLSLAWATAQLGWIFGPLTLFLFSLVTFYTSSLLADCYRTPRTNARNYTYIHTVETYLGPSKRWLCGFCQYVNLFGVGVGYTITAAISAAAVKKSNCFHKKGHLADCRESESLFMVVFGVIQILLSQLPNLHDLWLVSIIAAAMSFCYSTVAVGLSLAELISGHTGKTTITGIEIGVDINASDKVWNTFKALGDVAFAYSYSVLLVEIQDTLGSPPGENETMKKASLIGVSTTTVFYALSGCLGYLAFGNKAPGNILTGFGFYEPYWLIDLANVAIIIHLVGAYQVYLQPLFAAIESWIGKKWPSLKISREVHIFTIRKSRFSLNTFRLLWRSAFVVITTLLAILMPFFNDILAMLGALAFWPLTVYFPVEMYMARKSIQRYTPKWLMLQTLSVVCFLVSLAAACGSIEGVATALRHYVPFHTKS